MTNARFPAAFAVVVAAVTILAAVAAAGIGPNSPRGDLPGTGAPSFSHRAPTSLASPATSSASSAGAQRAAHVLQEIRASSAPSQSIHLPDLGVAPPRPHQLVEPTYQVAPAPMGVADLGISNVSGVLQRSVLYTPSVEGTVNFTNALSVYLDGDGADQFGIQLNAVLDNVTLFDNASNEFWSQAFLGYTPSSGELEFGDNVWNFSSYAGIFTANSLYAWGPSGVNDAPILYYENGPTFTIHYPFSVTMYENSTVLDDRPALYFNYTLANNTMSTSGSFDYLIFNATAGTPTTPYSAGEFQISGEQLDPAGLPNDLELDVVGTGDGDTTSFYEMDATASIATWNTSAGRYVPVASAFDAGSETGETSDGISVSYSGAGDVANLGLGPSFLQGLWGWDSESGTRTVVQTLHPAATLIFVNPGSSANASTAQWVPSSPTDVTTFSVPNGGEYWVQYLLADHDPGGFLLNGADNSTTTTAFTAGPDPALGVYTPLIVFGNGELAGVSSGGTGSPARPYTLYNNQLGSLDPEFAAVNDWLFPVFPGILLIGTTADVSVTPPSLEIDYPSWILPQIDLWGLPASNDLQIQLWDASNVRIVGGTVSGWLASPLAELPEGSVLLWNSSDNLIDGVTFLDQGDAITLYGGTGNTLWGNYFFPAPVAATNPENVLNLGPFTVGVNESENGDLIYNNYFDVPVPATTPTWDPLSCEFVCTPVVYNDSWNVSLQPAAASQTVLGETLTGSIAETWYQGGNYWSNYGNQSDPFGVLPYNDSGQITSGGDYVPLTPYTLYDVSFVETGLPVGTMWGVSVLVAQESNGTQLNVSVPNGTYDFTVDNPTGYTAGFGGNFSVDGAPLSVPLAFVPTVNLTFEETGLPSGENWSVALNGTSFGGVPENASAAAGTPIVFAVGPGTYFFNVTGPILQPVPAFGELNLTAEPAIERIVFGPEYGNLVGRVTPASAALYVGGEAATIGAGGAIDVRLAVGWVSVELSAAGYAPYFNNVSITADKNTSLSVTLAPLSATAGPSADGISAIGWALIGFLAFLAVLFLAMTLVFAGRRRLPPEGLTPYAAPLAPAATSAQPAPSPAAPASSEPAVPEPEATPPPPPPPPPLPPSEPVPPEAPEAPPPTESLPAETEGPTAPPSDTAETEPPAPTPAPGATPAEPPAADPPADAPP